MALKAEGKSIRRVNKHSRTSHGRRIKVADYWQRYNKPRGERGKLAVARGGKTAWLKDRKGKFIGRANAKGETSTARERIKNAGYDTTKNIRESGYGRIYGRTPAGRR